MGLSICKKIATGLGGDLTLTPDYTDGCKFTLSLTLETFFHLKPKTVDSRLMFRKKFGSKDGGEKEKNNTALACIFELDAEQA